jgi:hypothetical protein
MISNDSTDPGLEEATNPGGEALEEEPSLDPIEDAWLSQEPETVEALAKSRLAENADDARARAWLGLACCITERMPQGQAELTRAFDLLRAELARAQDDEAKHAITWEMHAIANRLTDTLSETAAQGVAAATFVIDQLKFEHSPSLRMISEHTAVEGGDAVRAAGFLKRALVVDATDPESHFLAARLFARLGKKPQVLSHLQKALDNAAGTIAVRTLARYEPDFDGLRQDPEFFALVDPFPKDETLRPIYEAIDAGDFSAAVEFARAALPSAANRLDVLLPLREALEQVADRSEGDEVPAEILEELEQLSADIDAAEEAGEESAVYARFCGDA